MLISDFFESAPEGCSERVKSAYALLNSLGVPYRCVTHAPAESMEVCAAISDKLEARICKNLFLCNRQQTSFYLLAMPEDKPFYTKDLSHQIGSSRLSFAPPEKMEELLGCSPGSCSVLGLANDTAHCVHLLLDRDVVESERFACHPCDNTGSLTFQTRDLLEKVLPHTGHTYEIVEL
ncbi:MAG: prolyl-tRNA synthetase associated domain-containing protein [Oscillospiraceae bacterium]|nr:prolyl-tRNA synthetase associated domain-containing protein [Oscillospiraceae bacterium]